MKKTRTERNSRHQEKPAEPETTDVTTTTVPAPPVEPVASAPAATPPDGKKETVQIVIRLPADLAGKIDGYVERLRAERLGLRVSRADAVRILVHERLVELDLAREWPVVLKHEGKTYYRTGKIGTSRTTGAPAAEYEDEDRARVWRDANGAVRAE